MRNHRDPSMDQRSHQHFADFGVGLNEGVHLVACQLDDFARVPHTEAHLRGAAGELHRIDLNFAQTPDASAPPPPTARLHSYTKQTTHTNKFLKKKKKQTPRAPLAREGLCPALSPPK